MPDAHRAVRTGCEMRCNRKLTIPPSPPTAGASLVRPAGRSIRLRRAYLPFAFGNQTAWAVWEPYGNFVLDLIRFIPRQKLSVKTAQLTRLPLTSDAVGAACPPAGRTARQGDHDAGTGVRRKWLCVTGQKLLRRKAVYGVQGQPTRCCHRVAPGFCGQRAHRHDHADVDRPRQR